MEKQSEQQTKTSNSEAPLEVSPPVPARHRLSSKQIAFFKNVFCANRSVSETLTDLNIRLSTFDRWLTKPLFRERLAQHINHYYFETRMELARNAPQAVSGLNFLSEKSLRHKEVRQACNDLLNLHTQYGKLSQPEFEKIAPKSNPKQRSALEGFTYVPEGTKNGEVSDNFGEVLEKFGIVTDNNGATKDKQCNTKTPKNTVFNTKNKENAKFPRLVSS